jgi:hypothetical protein
MAPLVPPASCPRPLRLSQPRYTCPSPGTPAPAPVRQRCSIDAALTAAMLHRCGFNPARASTREPGPARRCARGFHPSRVPTLLLESHTGIITVRGLPCFARYEGALVGDGNCAIWARTTF